MEINIVQWNEEEKKITKYLHVFTNFTNISQYNQHWNAMNITEKWVCIQNKNEITKWNNVLVIHIKASDGTVEITEWLLL